MPFRSLLKTTPPDAVHSLEELFAIAHAMEREAGTHYRHLAARMRGEGNPQLADLFDRLAAEEEGHEEMVVDWSERRTGKEPDAAAIRWALPETFDKETAADLASSKLINTYRVLSMAVRNEETAFTLWSYIAAEADKPEIQQAAEKMAREELEHISMLRRARRAAYHAERGERPQARSLSVDALIGLAAALEHRLAARLDALSGSRATTEAAKARELAAQARSAAETLAALSSAPEADVARDGQEDGASALAERLVEAYLDIGDRSRDQALLEETQHLARQAIARLAWLRHSDAAMQPDAAG